MTRQDAAALAEPARSRVRVPPPRDTRDDTSSAAEPATGSAKTAERSEGGMSEEERRELRALVQRRLGGRTVRDFLGDLDRLEADLMATRGEDWH